MRRKGHPSFPSAMTCCFFSSLKTLLMPREPIRPPFGVYVPGLSLAGFQATFIGRFCVTPEGRKSRVDRTPKEKWQIVQEGMKNGNVSETCRRHGIAQALYYRGKDTAGQGAKAALGGRALPSSQSL